MSLILSCWFRRQVMSRMVPFQFQLQVTAQWTFRYYITSTQTAVEFCILKKTMYTWEITEWTPPQPLLCHHHHCCWLFCKQLTSPKVQMRGFDFQGLLTEADLPLEIQICTSIFGQTLFESNTGSLSRSASTNSAQAIVDAWNAIKYHKYNPWTKFEDRRSALYSQQICLYNAIGHGRSTWINNIDFLWSLTRQEWLCLAYVVTENLACVVAPKLKEFRVIPQGPHCPWLCLFLNWLLSSSHLIHPHKP